MGFPFAQQSFQLGQNLSEVDLNRFVPMTTILAKNYEAAKYSTLRAFFGMPPNGGQISDNTTLSELIYGLDTYLSTIASSSELGVNQSKDIVPAIQLAFSGIEAYQTYSTQTLTLMNYENVSRKMYILDFVFLIVGTLLFITRFWSRYILMKRMLAADWIMVVGWIGMSTYTMASILGPQECLGKHVWDCTYEGVVRITHIAFVQEWTYSISLFLVKLSITCFYWSLSPVPTYRNMLKIVGLVLVLQFAANRIPLLLQCKPIDFWNYPLTAVCIDRYPWLMVEGSVNVALDIAILLCPMWLIYHMTLGWQGKVMAGGLFGLGVVVCIVGGLRLRSIKGLTQGTDITWWIADAGFWSLLEGNTAMTCANLPATKGLVVYYYHKYFNRTKFVTAQAERAQRNRGVVELLDTVDLETAVHNLYPTETDHFASKSQLGVVNSRGDSLEEKSLGEKSIREGSEREGSV